jgi:hypothetical protein
MKAFGRVSDNLFQKGVDQSSISVGMPNFFGKQGTGPHTNDAWTVNDSRPGGVLSGPWIETNSLLNA